jgi:hypothetical protein
MGPAPLNVFQNKPPVHINRRLKGKSFRFGFFRQPAGPEY